MDFDQPNAENGQKIANGQLLFLAMCDTMKFMLCDLLKSVDLM